MDEAQGDESLTIVIYYRKPTEGLFRTLRATVEYVQINSRPLVSSIKDIMEADNYIPVDIEPAADHVKILPPFRSIFHLHQHLIMKFNASFPRDEEANGHLTALLGIKLENLPRLMATSKRIWHADEPEVSFSQLEALFPMATIVCETTEDGYGGPRAYLVGCARGEYTGDKEERAQGRGEFILKVQSLVFDGKNFSVSTLSRPLVIKNFVGYRRPWSLTVCPLALVRNGLVLQEHFVTLGRLYARLCQGRHFMWYGGEATAVTAAGQILAKTHINSRIIIDRKIWADDATISCDDYDDLVPVKLFTEFNAVVAYKRLGDDDAAIVSPSDGYLYGIALDTKKPYRFFVENIREIYWDSELFHDFLHLISDYKSSLLFMAKEEVPGTFLLFGPPGVGKNWTAQGISEHLHRPHYVVKRNAGLIPEEHLMTSKDPIWKDILLAWAIRAILVIQNADQLFPVPPQGEADGRDKTYFKILYCAVIENPLCHTFLITDDIKAMDTLVQDRIPPSQKFEFTFPVEIRRFRIWRKLWDEMQGRGKIISHAGSKIFWKLASYYLNYQQIGVLCMTALEDENRINLETLEIRAKQYEWFNRSFGFWGVLMDMSD